MRITGGSLCGCHVAAPGGIIRPAMDRMRESVFATMGDLTGCSFLDIFSGSGVIALEAASRGASCIEAVENDPIKRKTLLRNVTLSPVRIQCRFMPAELYTQRAKRSFDIIFCDPPFLYEYKWALVKAIANSALMKRGARLLIHRPREDFLRYAIDNLILERTKKYGRSVVDFFVLSR
ncbi:MAG: RsmD family RNA methyltransferase [Treponema sp.]|jgi:16S rRNA (guanine(966)-N(2))-methyltransferase RsmD|nr:RsmD family RNA methyltransferase [Treponema sp.]